MRVNGIVRGAIPIVRHDEVIHLPEVFPGCLVQGAVGFDVVVQVLDLVAGSEFFLAELDILEKCPGWCGTRRKLALVYYRRSESIRSCLTVAIEKLIYLLKELVFGSRLQAIGIVSSDTQLPWG